MNNSEINTAFEKLNSEFKSIKQQTLDLKGLTENSLSEALQSIESGKNEYEAFKSSQIEQHTSIRDKYTKSLDDLIINLNDHQEKLDSFSKELFEGDESIENVIKKIEDEIKSYQTELLIGDSETESIKSKISKLHFEILDYKNDLFGYKEFKGEGEVIEHAGIKYEVEKIVEKFNKSLEKFKKDTGDLIEEKTGEMDSLLEKMDLNYNAVEQEALSRKFFELANERKKSINYSTLLLSIYSLLLTGALMYLFTSETLKTLFSGNLISGSIIRIAITVPVMYLIVSTANKLKREISIRDQYNYKGSLMTTYRNVSTHIKNVLYDFPEQKQIELLDEVFSKILENEADKLEESSQFEIKHLSKFVGGLAKDLGTDSATLISVLPEIIEKLNQAQESNTSKPQEKEEE